MYNISTILYIAKGKKKQNKINTTLINIIFNSSTQLLIKINYLDNQKI